MKRLCEAILWVLALGFLGSFPSVWAETTGTGAEFQHAVKIEGRVVDAETGEPLFGANVTVVGAAYGAATDRRGKFQMFSLPVGSYTLRAQMIGYTTAEKADIRILEDATVHVNFRLRPTFIRLGSLLVWGEREALSEWNSPGALRIISSRMLRESGAQDLGDFLKSQPGLLVYDTGGRGGKQTVSIRGSHTNQVLILIDGVKLNPAQNSTVDLSTLSLNWIDHIEILKSGGATLFGNDAIGGVINIVTRKSSGSDPSVSVKAARGSFGAKQAALFVSPLIRLFHLNLSAQEREAEGNFHYSDLFGRTQIRRNNAFRDWNIFLEASRSGLLGGKAYFSLQRYRARRGVPGALRQLTPHASLQDNRWLLQAGWKIPLKKAAILDVTGFYQRYRQTFFSPRPWVFSPVNSFYVNEAAGFQTHAQIFANSGQPLFTGVDFRLDGLRGQDRIRPQKSLGRVTRQTFSAFLLWRAKMLLPSKLFFQKLVFSPGFRADFPSDFPDVTSPSVGFALVRKGKLCLTLKGTWGKTYRAPTFNSLFWVEDVFARGNPNLRPERATNRDLGFKLAGRLLGQWEAEEHFFDNRVRDLIYWRRNFDGKYMPVNVSAARLRGREDALSVRFWGEHLKLSWYHTRLLAVNHSGERTTEGKLLPFRPKHAEIASLHFNWSHFFTTISRRWVSRRFTREANTKSLLPYTVWNAQFGVNLSLFTGKLRIGAEIENATNTRYQILERYPMPGRSVELRIEFQK